MHKVEVNKEAEKRILIIDTDSYIGGSFIDMQQLLFRTQNKCY